MTALTTQVYICRSGPTDYFLARLFYFFRNMWNRTFMKAVGFCLPLSCPLMIELILEYRFLSLTNFDGTDRPADVRCFSTRFEYVLAEAVVSSRLLDCFSGIKNNISTY